MVKKILFLPFLSLSSGHHQAADAMIEHIRQIDPSIVCEKVDILSYSYGKVEQLVSAIYLKWIHSAPYIYSWIYRKTCMKGNRMLRRYFLYEQLFLHFMQRLIQDSRPDFIVCTHSLPSYLLGQLKRRNRLSIPIANVYTDYFINNIWGREEIDYHFAPDFPAKQWLEARGVPSERIIVTGIPVHPRLMTPRSKHHSGSGLTILVTGGNLGAGADVIRSVLASAGTSDKVNYIVLCGKNRELYQAIRGLKRPQIVAMPYIESREEMNSLYDQIDAVCTKPGGVTVSECLVKQIPIFVYHTLPGQEEINLQHLLGQQLVIPLADWEREGIEHQMITLWNNKQGLIQLQKRMEEYRCQMTDLTQAFHQIFSSLK
ncbi:MULTISPECIES: MGDG synthase family glycosyltransferase [unclassified Paenibacillus]|uniref:MGDG synthase family glycosyltransferase n=1 Tax=unclassified Paenibacillus TaxID=185978 RepID=UPI0011AAC81E|nr:MULTISPECIES: glycosyltransferase [Paenibacillaceae]